jgi:2-methylcitrate dehydratase
MPSAVERIAAAVHSVDPATLPQPVVARAKALILDSLGCMLGGIGSIPAVAVRSVASRLGGHAQATLVGCGARASVTQAVLANGTALRFLDANDYHFGRDPTHPSGSLPVGLALAEMEGRSGAELIAALAVAYELHIRLADFAGTPTLWKRGWHHSTNLTLAVSAMAGRLLGSDPRATANGMAIALTHGNTLAQLQSGGIANIKAVAEAFVAKTALEAALLAQDGITGPMQIIEGAAGWVRTVAGEAALDDICAPIGGTWRLLDSCIKPYAAVATAMAPVQAAIDLAREHDLVAADIAAVTVMLPAFPLGTPSASPERRFPPTVESAHHSFYFCVAAALLDRACSEAQFAPGRLDDPALRDMLGRIALAEDPALTARWPVAGGGVVLRLSDGRVLERRHHAPPGHPDNPLPRTMLEEKFLTHAVPALGRARAERVIALVDALETAERIDPMMEALA